jgi:Lar family restriction alleviation protein
MVYLMPACECDCKTCNGGNPAPPGVFGGSMCTCSCHKTGINQKNKTAIDRIFEKIMPATPLKPKPTEDKMSDNEKCQNELKPCPFCGDDKPYLSEDWPDCAKRAEYTVYCSANGCEAGTCWQNTKDKAMSAWNDRPTADLKALQDKIAELEADKERLDWLIKNADYIELLDGAICLDIECDCATPNKGDGLRESIDKARK